MSRKLKYLSLILFSAGLILLCIDTFLTGNDNVSAIYPAHPLAVFADQNLTQPTNIVIKADNLYPVIDRKKIIIDPKAISEQTMIRRYTISNQIELYGNKYWCSENIIVVLRVGKDGSKIFIQDLWFEANTVFLALALLSLSIGSFMLHMYLKTSQTAYSLLPYLFFWYAGLMIYFYLHGFFFVYNVDNNDWVMMGKDWLENNRQYFRSNTFGLTYLYAFFIWLLDARCFNDLAVPVSLVNFIAIGSISLMSILFISYRIFKSIRIIHVTGIIAVVFPLTAWIFHKGVFGQPDFIGKTMLYFGQLHPYSLSHWYQSILLCWNGMSDNFSIGFALAGFAFALWMKPSFLKYAMLGLILGIGMCLRGTSLLLWPSIFLLDFYFNYMKGQMKYGKMLSYLLVFGAVAFLAYLPQPLDNYLNYGGIFQREGGYWVKDSGDNLFTISLANNINALQYFIQINFKGILAGVFCLYFIRTRITGMSFWLWMLIPLIFHSFLLIYYITPLRYVLLLYPCIYILAGMLVGSLERNSLLLFIPMVLANYVLVAPENPGTYAPIFLQYKWHFIIPAISVVAAWCLYRKLKIPLSHMVCFTIFMILFISGQWWVVLAVLAVYPAYIILGKGLMDIWIN